MSLVNDMLRDLDRRGRDDQRQQALNTVFHRTPAEARPPYMTLAVIAGVLIALGLALGLAYLRRLPAPPPAVVPEAERVAVAAAAGLPGEAAPAAEQIQAPVPAVAELIRINREESGQGYSVTAFFTQDVGYEVLQQGERVLSLVIPHARLAEAFESRLPGLDVLETPAGLSLNLDSEQRVEFSIGVNNGSLLPALSIHALHPAPQEAPAPYPEAAEPAVAQSAGEVPLQTSTMPAAESLARGTAEAGEGVDAAAPVEAEREELRSDRQPSFEERDHESSRNAVALAQQGRLREAYALLADFVSANPAAHQSRETLATLLIAQQEFARAGEVLGEGLEIAPNHSGYRKLQARLYMREDRLQEAIGLLQRMPPDIGEDVEYHDLLAALLQQAGEHGKAVAAYQALLRTDPRQARWWTAMAISQEALGKPRDAMASYEAASRIPGIDPRLKRYSEGRINSLRLKR